MKKRCGICCLILLGCLLIFSPFIFKKVKQYLDY